MRHLASFALAILVLQTNVASAATPVAVLGVEAVDAPATIANLLTQALLGQVRRSPGVKLVQSKDIAEIKLVFGCVEESPDCMAKAGQSLHAARVLWGTLRQTPAGYNFTVQWLDVERALVDRSISDTIMQPKLTAAAAEQLVRRMTSSFLPADRGSLRIFVNEEGAEVKVGTRAVGLSTKQPLELREIPAGTYLVSVTKAGYELWNQRVPVASGQTAEVKVELVLLGSEASGTKEVEPAGAAASGLQRGSTTWKTVFWSGVAAAVAMGGVAVFSGFRVRQREQDKSERLEADYGGQAWAHDTDDVCAAAKTNGASAISDICQSGKRWALTANILAGAAGAVALFSIYSGYMAYFAGRSSEGASSPKAAQESASLHWQLAPSAGAHGAGLDLRLRF